MHYLKCVTKIQDEIKKTFMSEENIKEAIRQRFVEITANIPHENLMRSCQSFERVLPSVLLKSQMLYNKLNFS